jgi:hypothetical protein
MWKENVLDRVTRLLYLRQFFENYFSKTNFELLFSKEMLCINFDNTYVGLGIGLFFNLVSMVLGFVESFLF